MATHKDYLSEFEQEWNADSETTDILANELELESDDFESSMDIQFESGDEMEVDDESENDNEFELSTEDNEMEVEDEAEWEADDEANPRFEDRLYAALTGSHESELEFEQQISRVIHDQEIEYFFKPFTKMLKKAKNSSFGKLLQKVAKATPIGSAIKQYTALARGDIKGLLKSLAGQALSAAAPGGGIAKQLLNLEAPIANSNPRQNAKIINQVAKNSYGNLVNQLATLQPNQLGNLKTLGKASFKQAWQSAGRTSQGNVRRITLRKGQKLIVRVI
jgi:hypothetical protein